MALDGTFTGLKASIADWLKRSDLSATQLGDLVTLAEARIARDLRLRSQITYATLTTTAGVSYVSVPSDFLELENITLVDSVERQLTYQTPEQLDQRFPVGSGQGKPAAYSIIGDRLYLGPVPVDAFGISFTYYARFAALSSAGTNWLLTKHPSIYLSAAMSEAALFTFDDARAASWEAKYQADMKTLQDADDTSLRSGTVMRVRAIV